MIGQVFGEETCTYQDVSGVYTCVLKDLNLEGELIIAAAGHVDGKTDADVKALKVETSKLKLFPRTIFTKFANLESLDLPEVQMDTFGDKIASCAKLTTVNLLKNKFTSVPDGFFSNCGEITVLSLAENLIVEVPENALVGLTKLTKVHLNGNQIATLNMNIFKNNRVLVEILLSSNKFTKLDANVFKSLDKLETLDLSNNQIDEVPSFEGCTSLKEIHLRLNKIPQLKASVFKSQTKMTKLVLANNTITEIKAESFEGCDLLESLDLKTNKIKHIEKEFFDKVPKLKTLELDQNECVSKTFTSIKIEDIKKESELNDCYNSAASLKISAVLVLLYAFINFLK